MKTKDIEEIKFDLGLCADALMALVLGLLFNKLLGCMYFLVSLITETIIFIKKRIKLFRSDVK